MKCISIKQPWASFICPQEWMYKMCNSCHLPKDVENRSWSTTYRGLLLIHASQTYDLTAPIKIGAVTDYPRGAIIGMVELYHIGLEAQSPWHNHGYYGWYLKDSFTFAKPIPWKVEIGLFDVPGFTGQLFQKVEKQECSSVS